MVKSKILIIKYIKYINSYQNDAHDVNTCGKYTWILKIKKCNVSFEKYVEYYLVFIRS